MIELKPCPFCGEEADVFTNSAFPNYVRVHCSSAECSACDSHWTIDEWNTRPSPWQPIETAPRDGTKIVVYDELTGYTPFVYWDDEDDEWISEFMGWGGKPTHWQPIEPPQ